MTKLFTHPWHTQDNATFEREYECWFANMCTNKCGGLEPNADRRKPLTEKCTDNDVDWLQVWKEFSDDEVQYFKKEYPSAEIKEEGAEACRSRACHEQAGDGGCQDIEQEGVAVSH